MITAHYGVEGDGFYGLQIAGILPYVVVRTWHVQLGHLLDCDRVARRGALHHAGRRRLRTEVAAPRRQRPLRCAARCRRRIDGRTVAEREADACPTPLWFWFGHSGYEYIDLGRAWQIALLIGLFLWLGLVARGIVPALKRGGEQRPILTLLFIATMRHRRLLRRGARLRPAHQSRGCRVLAVVGGSPVGGRVLRGVRDRRDRVPLRAARPRQPAHGR
ncbi:MAG: hypothetical protein QM736_19990 [Vicinamibacterales bacterium]